MLTHEYTSQLVGRLHLAICNEVGSSPDVFNEFGVNYEKKIAVFVLEKFYGYERKHMAWFYKMHQMYFPYHIEKITHMYVNSELYQKMIMKILDVCDYGFKKVD